MTPIDSTYNSPLLDAAVSQLSRLPGIGQKTALRLALHILRRDEDEATALGQSIIDLRKGVKYCKVCHNISTTDVCDICSDRRRDASQICVVESVKDVLTIESTRQYHGLYHVLGGVISPAEGVGPSDIAIESLVERVNQGGVAEVILALSPNMEGDTTSYYIFRRLQSAPQVELTMLARGLSIGNDLEYTDELTLGRSLQNRIPFNQPEL